MLFVRLFDLCLFGFVCPLSLGVWEGLQLVIVALPGIFIYLNATLSSDFQPGGSLDPDC